MAAVGPVIKAKHEDITYAISATFIFDIITVIIFPWIGLRWGCLIQDMVIDWYSR